RPDHAAGRHLVPGPGRARLPGHRRRAPVAQLGRLAERSLQVHQRRPRDDLRAGRHDRPHGAGGLPHRGRPAGPPGDRRLMTWEPRIDLDRLLAIDVHVHAGISATAPPPATPDGGPRPSGVRSIQQRIGVGHQTPDETAAYYRERRIAAVIWRVDPRARNGMRPGAVDNDELLEAASRASDVLIPI